MMVSGGNVSGIANQLEGEGFIDRSPVPDNRRTLCVTLTEKGRGRFADMASAHEGWVVEMLGDLSQSEHQQIMKHLGQLKRGVSSLED
jgi:DNA-binding MarR family transcriptional regulator